MRSPLRIFSTLLLVVGLMTNFSAWAATATISSTLGGATAVKANQLTPFDVTISQGDVPDGTTGKIVFQLVGDDVATKATQLELEYTLNGTDWTDLTVSETGEAVVNDVAIENKTIAFRALFSAVGTFNYTLKLLNAANNEVVAMADKSVVVRFTEPTINTTLDAYPYLIQNQEYLFHPFVTAGDRAGEMVNMQIVLADPSQASNVQFFRSTNAEGTEFTPLTFDGSGVITIGGEAGYPLADAEDVGENLLKAVFTAPGEYGYTFRLVRVGGVELAKVDEVITVSETAIGSTLPNKEDLKTTVPVEFTVSASSAVLAPETLVYGRLTLADPSQADNITLEVKDANNVYQEVTIGADGMVMIGTAEGMALTDFKNLMYRVTFDAAGTYSYTLNLVKVEGNEVVATKSESVMVEAFQNATIASSFANADNILAGQESAFTLATTKGDLSDKSVRFKFILNDASQANNVIIENTDAAESVRLVFGTDGVAYYMPVLGPVALADQSYNFTALFSAAGTYNYTVQLIDAAAPGEVLATTNVSVEAKTTTNIRKGFEKGGFAVYPTLTTGTVRIDLVDARNATIQIIDIMGRSVVAKSNVNGVVEVDLSSFAKGTYVVKIQDGNQVNTQRVIVQ